MQERRADVQALSDLELYVYDAIASADKHFHTVGDAEIAEMAEAAGATERDVRAALDRLVELNHVRAAGSGYSLGPHDWAP